MSSKLEIRFSKGHKIKVASFVCFRRMPATKFSSWTFIEFRRYRDRSYNGKSYQQKGNGSPLRRYICRDFEHPPGPSYIRAHTRARTIFCVQGTRNGDMMF